MDHCSKLFLMILVSSVVAVLLVGCAATDTPIPTIDEIPTLDLPDTVSPPTSTAEVQVTAPPVNTPRPTFLPDLAAFVGENGADRSTLWLINEDGKELYTPFPELDRASDLQWSSQGWWLGFTFTQGAQRGLMLFNPFTGQQRLVPNSYPGPWRWAADGSQLAFFATVDRTCQLGIYALQDGSVRLLDAMHIDITCENYFGPVWITDWTSDGRYLFFDAGTGANRGLTVIDVIDDREVICLSFTVYTSAKISPDGAYLALDLTEGDEPYLHDPSLTIIDVRSGEQQIVTSGVIFEDWYRVLDWLPDGRILYLWSHQQVETYWYFNPQTDQAPVPAEDYQVPQTLEAVIAAQLPETVQLRSFSISPDEEQAAICAYDGEAFIVYLMDLEKDSLSEPIANGWSLQWQPISREVSEAEIEAAAISSPAPTDTPEPVALASMRMLFWEVWFSYNPDVWHPGGNQYMPSITHNQIPECMIQEQGPTEYPDVTREVDLGNVHYMVSELILYGSHVDWYLAEYGPNGSFAGGLPTLIVTGLPDQYDTCLADAWVVLATLTEIDPGSATVGLDTSSAGFDFECLGALAPRLWVDGYAFVSYAPPLSNRVRSGAGTNFPVVGIIPPGEVVRVTGGPACANGWVWWEIEVVDSGLSGWTVEGEAPNYWLIPCASEEDCGQ